MAVEAARAALAAIPAFAGYKGPLERLGGLTNLVYRAGEACLRIPGKGTEEYINRANEGVAAREAAKAGVSPDVLHFDGATGLMVTRFIGGAETMSPEKFKTRPGSPARAGEAFRKLHRSGAVFPFRFELFAMIDDYLKVLSTRDVALPAGYHDVVREAGAVRAALDAHPAPLAACHCDPLWDLGDLSVEGRFDAAQDEAMMRAYFGGEARPAERGRIVIHKAMCDLLWTLWGLIQLANNNPADDFRAYADGRFARCKALMETPDFSRHLAAVRLG